MRLLGLEPDPWQVQVLEAGQPRLLLNCCRQAGKSTVAAILALVEALYRPDTLVLLLSRSLRQSTELFRKVVDFHRRLRCPLLEACKSHELRTTTRSRIVSLPCRDETIRGFSHVGLLIIDEASRVPDSLYRAVRPMLATSQGRLLCLSTPNGKHGFFYEAWAHGGADWARVEIPASAIPRIPPTFLEEERRCLGEAFFRQEYECSFQALQGLVYPDFARCVVPALPASLVPLVGQGRPGPGGPPLPKAYPEGCRRVGGLDFGFRNPFAAVWGIVDRDDILWLTGEHYQRQQPLSHHARHLPPGYVWYADPAGASEIAELRCAGFPVRLGNNALRPGIAAVSARLAQGTLRVLAGACPHLLREAELYRYGTEEEDRRTEAPVDEHNHALAALRYLVSKLDAGRMARLARGAGPSPAAEEPDKPKKPADPWMDWRNEALWTRLF
jgi:hypothetical protein